MHRCLACGQESTTPLCYLGEQPLTNIDLPDTEESAINVTRYELDFWICTFCGHVFNIKFKEAQVPYNKDSYIMYNKGLSWEHHVDKVVDWINHMTTGLIIDIGCGDGDFGSRIKSKYARDIIGFEPGLESKYITSFPVINDYFAPSTDIKTYSPSIITLRHVIEHMESPLRFLSEIAINCDDNTQLYVEVPCYEKGLKNGRISDLIYEHVSHFCRRSLQALLKRAGFTVTHEMLSWNDEILMVMAKVDNALTTIKENIQSFKKKSHNNDIFNQLAELRHDHNSIILWGSSGKSSLFINTFNLNKNDYPTVVDSDSRKVGYYVAGTGQKILPASYLANNYVDIIIITTPTRVDDILIQIHDLNISCKMVLYPNNGILETVKQ